MIRFALLILLTLLLAFASWAHHMYMSGVNPFPLRSGIWVALVGVLTPVRAVLLYAVLVFALFYRSIFPKQQIEGPDSTLLDDEVN